MNDEELELLIKDAQSDFQSNSTWVENLKAHIKEYSLESKVDLNLKSSIEKLFNANIVCSPGSSNSSPIDATISDEKFRKWFSDCVDQLRIRESDNISIIKDIKKFFDESIHKFRNHGENAPKLKLTRAFCTLFPKYFTTIGSEISLTSLHEKIFGNKDDIVQMHFNIKQKIEQVLQNKPAENTDDFIRGLILPWLIYEKIPNMFIDIPNYTNEELKSELSSFLSKSQPVGGYLSDFLRVLTKYDENLKVTRQSIEDQLVKYERSNKNLNKVSQFLTDKNRGWARQLIGFDFKDGIAKSGAEKVSYHIRDGYRELIKEVLNELIESHKNEETKVKKNEYPRNQILYGPPGTGKTFNTINMALAIADPSFDLQKPRVDVKKRFEELVELNQIVFTTFHQSMSYEDFIEGIKPETVDGKVEYEIKLGIFKKICRDAITPNRQSFEDAYKSLQNEIENLEDPKLLPIRTPTGKEFFISINSKGNISLYTGTDKTQNGVLTFENLQQQISGEKTSTWWKSYFNGVIDYLEKKHRYSRSATDFNKDYVIIIDEINRGNVSAIFGELITLIEENKRLGMPESLKLLLPYSKEEFGVPNNVFIIGTMNTADRSVEALDAALRRRFSFVEKLPDPELISQEGKLKDTNGKLVLNGESIDLPEVLKRINSRLVRLLDKDHQIGHSYFMDIEDLEGLTNAFRNKIVPLLQEYFFGDYGKIGLVLGKGFVEQVANDFYFAEFDSDIDATDYEEKISYQIKKIDSKNIFSAVQSLLKNF